MYKSHLILIPKEGLVSLLHNYYTIKKECNFIRKMNKMMKFVFCFYLNLVRKEKQILNQKKVYKFVRRNWFLIIVYT